MALLLVRWRRRRQHSQAVLHKNQPSSSGSETSVEMVFRPQDGSSGYGQQMFLPTSRSLSPPDSLAGSSESRRNNKVNVLCSCFHSFLPVLCSNFSSCRCFVVSSLITPRLLNTEKDSGHKVLCAIGGSQYTASCIDFVGQD